MNRDLPFFFPQKIHAGFVISPWKAQVLCSFFTDYGTMGKVCNPPGVHDDCVPGCWVGTPNWCEGDRVWDCAYGPDRLDKMLQNDLIRLGITPRNGRRLGAQYNEVIVEWQSLVRDLPDAIEAFFYADASAKDSAVNAHQQFLLNFPGAKAPLLRMNLHNEEAIFSPDR